MNHHDQHHGAWTMGAHVTAHCLTGCVVGEVAGLMIGVSAGLSVWATMRLATVLAFITGFTLGALPVMRAQSVSLLAALRRIWLGEAVSIGVMELVMNGVDYTVGGARAASVFAPIFWLGLAAAIPTGFLAAWPVNVWLLSRDLRAAH